MIQLHITHQFAVRSLDGKRLPQEELHQQGEALMDALLDLEKCNGDVADSTTSTEADRGVVIVELLITADNETQALEKSMTITRTAIHAIGGCTPGWEQPTDPSADYLPDRAQLEYV